MSEGVGPPPEALEEQEEQPPPPEPPPRPTVAPAAAEDAPFAYLNRQMRTISGTGVAAQGKDDGRRQFQRQRVDSVRMRRADGAWSIEVPTPLDGADPKARRSRLPDRPETSLTSDLTDPPTLVKLSNLLSSSHSNRALPNRKRGLHLRTGMPGCFAPRTRPLTAGTRQRSGKR